jgi:hypothetical protein
MDRLYYVETDGETSETSSRLEAERIMAEWKKRGYHASTVVVDVTDTSVETVENAGTVPPQPEWPPPL